MTVKELFNQVGFDEIVPYLLAFEPEHKDNIHSYREAYDILLAMEPKLDKEDSETFVEWSGGEYGEDKWIGVYRLSNNTWEAGLAKEIIVADDVHLSLAELAMHCLWEITFYGFSPQTIEDNFKQLKQPECEALS